MTKTTKQLYDAVPFPLEMITYPNWLNDDSEEFPVMDKWEDIFNEMGIDEDKREELDIEMTYMKGEHEVCMVIGTPALLWYWKEDKNIIPNLKQWSVNSYVFRDYISDKEKAKEIRTLKNGDICLLSIDYLLARQSG